MTSVEDPTRQIKERESLCFNDFPEDIQLCILSFLSPTEISSFACTSKRFASLCRDDRKLWCALCERRWGTKTQIGKWGNGRITYRQLYRTLEEWKNLIGFWRRCGQTNTAVSSPPLIFFEWGPFFLCASRVYPSKNGTYQVKTAPFLWMGISPDGQILNFLDLDGQNNWSGDVEACFKFGILDGSFVPVNVNFMGNGHVLVEEDHSLSSTSREEKRIGFRRSSSFGNLRGEESEDVVGGIPGSLPECSVSEMYTQFANRTSPGSDRRRQRRKEKGRQGRRKWEPEHFVKVSDCSPTPSRPLQGLWKGLCDGTNLEFYLVTYDEVGGVICRRIGDLSSCYSPVFWTTNSTFIDSPFSPEEESVYDSRVHFCQPVVEDLVEGHLPFPDFEVVSHILYINSSYDLVIPGLRETSSNPWNAEGRIWLYKNGTFGFGFLRDHFIVDLKHIVRDGCLLDAIQICSD
ncbi:F-box protein At3g12350-like [Carica papaya]|uniref:F-box protein At3g12350-like n=1 Tax=Carica papaya TaxID=3649 RepID=UPI000B8C98BB|nr:F-box protein At3g12350-like [Carica papaya]